MDEIGLHARDDVVDHLALERERQLQIAVAAIIDRVAIVEATVLGEMNALVGEVALVLAELLAHKLGRLDVEHAAVVRQRHVHVGAKLIQRGGEGGGHVGHAARLRGHLARQVAHALRQIRDLRRDDQDSRILNFLFGHSSTTPVMLGIL